MDWHVIYDLEVMIRHAAFNAGLVPHEERVKWIVFWEDCSQFQSDIIVNRVFWAYKQAARNERTM